MGAPSSPRPPAALGSGAAAHAATTAALAPPRAVGRPSGGTRQEVGGEVGAAAPPSAEEVGWLGRALGVTGLVADAPMGRARGRVWRLRAPTSPACWYLKRAPSPAEVLVLRHLAETPGEPLAPSIAAWSPADPGAGAGARWEGGGPPWPVGEDLPRRARALCLTGLPGGVMAAALHAGAALPVEAWGRSMAALHARLEPLLSWQPPEAVWPARETLAADLQSRLPRWAGVAGRTHSADCGPLLAQAISALPTHLVHAGAGVEGDGALCHGAWSPDHFSVASGRLTGALDWEHVRVAPAAYDVATAVVCLFAHGLSARASRAIGDALAAAYASSGRAVAGWPFLLALLAVERLVQALDLRSQALGGADAPAWAGLAGLCLARL